MEILDLLSFHLLYYINTICIKVRVGVYRLYVNVIELFSNIQPKTTDNVYTALSCFDVYCLRNSINLANSYYIHLSVPTGGLYRSDCQ